MEVFRLKQSEIGTFWVHTWPNLALSKNTDSGTYTLVAALFGRGRPLARVTIHCTALYNVAHMSCPLNSMFSNQPYCRGATLHAEHAPAPVYVPVLYCTLHLYTCTPVHMYCTVHLYTCPIEVRPFTLSLPRHLQPLTLRHRAGIPLRAVVNWGGHRETPFWYIYLTDPV